MADNSHQVLDKFVFRVFSDQEGEVYLLLERDNRRVLEPGNRRVKVKEPVSNETIRQAQRELLLPAKREARAQFDSFSGAISERRTEANRKIEAALHPLRKGSFFRRLEYVRLLVLRESIFALGGLFIIMAPYKFIQYSSQHFPRPAHLLVLSIYLFALIFCIVVIATEENRWKASDKINESLGPRGFLVFPLLILVTAGGVIASITFMLHNKGLVILEACQGRLISEASLLDFYMWHFLKLVPLLKLNEVLKWNEPFCYSQSRVGFLILVFQGFVVIPSINTIRFYWKHRRSFAAPAGEYVFDPSWQPSTERRS